ncbi:MAG: exo-alpha-sialidase [Clostridia bacterium]|nr:exo-alpha-sialidase [Clostridia bacterium]
MKKIFSIIIATVLILNVFVTTAFAVDYERPFDNGVLGSKTFRIPALYTLNNGSVIAVADKRYDSGLDSPANIDIGYAISSDGYTNWKYGTLNSFDDYADGVTSTKSASFIDSAIVQSSNGRLFVISDAFPSGCGSDYAKRGTGFTEIDGVNRMLLTTGSAKSNIRTFNYYIGDFNGKLAPIYSLDSSDKTEYSVDGEYNLYKNGEPLYMAQKGSEGVNIQQNVYYTDAEFCCYYTSYIWLRYSDDNGVTWSNPVNLSAFVKDSKEEFLGVCPGRGIVTNVDGKERIIFCVYDNYGGRQNVSTIYSDDSGATWHRSGETRHRIGLVVTNESQIIELNDGVLRMFCRTNSNYVCYADSYDGGVTWNMISANCDLLAKGSCMSSFINTSKTIDGKKVVLGSYPSNFLDRADGVIRVGLVNDENDIDWISTYNVTDGFYAYSCLTELSDGNIALLYEDETYNINYMVLSLDDEGNVSEIIGNNVQPPTPNTLENIASFFNSAFSKILAWLHII